MDNASMGYGPLLKKGEDSGGPIGPTGSKIWETEGVENPKDLGKPMHPFLYFTESIFRFILPNPREGSWL